MAYPHHDSHTHESTTSVEEREGASGILIALGVILLVGLLVWLFAFSGVVFDRGGDTGDTTRIQIEDQNNAPGDTTTNDTTTNDTTTDGTTTDTEPAPVGS